MRFGSLMRILSWLCVLLFPLSSREVHQLGGRDQGPRNFALAREHPRWQGGRRAHQQHGPVSYGGAAERSFSPRGQVKLHRSDTALRHHVSHNVWSLKSRSHFNKESGRGTLRDSLGSELVGSNMWAKEEGGFKVIQKIWPGGAHQPL